MPAYFFRSEPGAAELRRLARGESGRVRQGVLMIANLLEGMEHEEAARLAGLSRSAAYEWHNRYEEEGIEGLPLCPRAVRKSQPCGPSNLAALIQAPRAPASASWHGMACWLPHVSCSRIDHTHRVVKLVNFDTFVPSARGYARAWIRSKSRELHQLHHAAGGRGLWSAASDQFTRGGGLLTATTPVRSTAKAGKCP
jgi:hypothetical protein